MTTIRWRAVKYTFVMGLVYGALIIMLNALLILSGTSVQELPHVIKSLLVENGFFGPLLLMAVYAVSAIVPVPTASLAAISGAVYGPEKGTVLALGGLWIASTIGFHVARILGAKAIARSKEPWIQHANTLLTERGFYPVLLSRLLHVPFDAVNVGAGLSGMPFRVFSLATVLGSIPSAILFAYFGESLNDPRLRVLLGLGIVILFILLYALRKLPLVKKYLLDV